MSSIDPDFLSVPPSDFKKSEDPPSIGGDIPEKIKKANEPISEGKSLDGRVRFAATPSPAGIDHIKEVTKTLPVLIAEITEDQKVTALRNLGLREELFEAFSDAVFAPENIPEGRKIYGLMKSGVTLVCCIDGDSLTFKVEDKLVDVESGFLTHSPGLSLKDSRALHSYVLDNKYKYVGKGKISTYLSTRQTGLARSLHFTPDGRVFVHLNKKTPTSFRKESDRLLGEGSAKVVTTAMDLSTGELYASASMTPQAAIKEKAFLKPFEGIKGFPKIESEVHYRSGKKGRDNVRLLSPLCLLAFGCFVTLISCVVCFGFAWFCLCLPLCSLVFACVCCCFRLLFPVAASVFACWCLRLHVFFLVFRLLLFAFAFGVACV